MISCLYACLMLAEFTVPCAIGGALFGSLLTWSLIRRPRGILGGSK